MRGSVALQLPWCGDINESGCQGIRVNHGLYTQCTGSKCDGTSYCRTCNKSGGPKYGDISTRGHEDFKYKNKVVRYSKVMDKLGITREAAEAAAAEAGVTIADTEFEKVETGRRGRPRKQVDTSSDDSDGEPKKRGRPKKTKAVVAKSAGEDLIASLMEAAQLVDDSSDIEKEEEKVYPMSSYAVSLENAEQFEADVLAQEAAKQAKTEKQAAEKQAKLEAKEAAKQAKLEAKEAEKQAKLEAKEAEKQAKLEAKEAEKQAKLEAKAEKQAAEKQAKLEAKEAEKQAKLEAKAEKQAAAKQAKLEAKEAEKHVSFEEVTAELTSVENTAFEEATAELTSVENTTMKEENGSADELESPTLNLSDSDQEMSEEEDDDDDGIEVDEFTWEGKNYIIEPNTGTLYDKAVFEDSGEPEEVGHYCSVTNEVTFS